MRPVLGAVQDSGGAADTKSKRETERRWVKKHLDWRVLTRGLRSFSEYKGKPLEDLGRL